MSYKPQGKRIIFVVKNLDIGGMQKALIAFANQLAKNNHVCVYSIGQKGAFENDLVDSIKILYTDEKIRSFVELMSTHKNQLRSDFRRYVQKGLYRFVQKVGFGSALDNTYLKNVTPFGEYDIALSYTGYPGIWDSIVLSKIRAKKKLVWIHNNPYSLGIDTMNAYSYYDRFNAIINVSNDCRDKLNLICSKLSAKNYLMYNIIDAEEIIRKSRGISPYSPNKFIISTVARIQNSSKRFDRIMSCCEQLLQEGIDNFEWYIVGDGPDMQWLKEQISKKNLGTYIKLNGFTMNPYPDIFHSNLFVLASDYEGLPVTLMEAKTLGVPIVVTDFDCAKEVVRNGYDGFIVEKTIKSLVNGIKTLITDQGTYQRIKKNAMDYNGTTELSTSQFDHILEELGL